MKKIILILLCLFLAQNANALCPKRPIKVNIVTRPGDVVYNHSHSRKEFSRYSEQPVSPNALGLTVTKLGMKMSGKSRAEQVGKNKFCVGLSEINFQIGYDKILVLIDKKYLKNSCNYKVIKDHENYHVQVSQQAMRFFQKDIERELREAVKMLRPEEVYSSARAEQIMSKQFKRVENKVEPLFAHINKKIAEKNSAIDTPESYRETTKLCPKW